MSAPDPSEKREALMPDLDTLARALGEMTHAVALIEAKVEALRQRLDVLAPPIAKRPPKAQGLRQDEVGKRTDES